MISRIPEPANRWVRLLCVMEMTGHLHRILIQPDEEDSNPPSNTFDFAGLGAGNLLPRIVQHHSTPPLS